MTLETTSEASLAKRGKYGLTLVRISTASDMTCQVKWCIESVDGVTLRALRKFVKLIGFHNFVCLPRRLAKRADNLWRIVEILPDGSLSMIGARGMSLLELSRG